MFIERLYQNRGRCGKKAIHRSIKIQLHTFYTGLLPCTLNFSEWNIIPTECIVAPRNLGNIRPQISLYLYDIIVSPGSSHYVKHLMYYRADLPRPCTSPSTRGSLHCREITGCTRRTITTAELSPAWPRRRPLIPDCPSRWRSLSILWTTSTCLIPKWSVSLARARSDRFILFH